VVLYDDALGGRIAEESAVLAALAKALQPGSAELAVVFQPIVAANSGSLLGVESLLRWNRRAGSSFRPDQFVPIAERSDLIVQLDMWVMRRALEQLAEWERVGHMVGVSMAVNVSARTLLRGSLLADVERLLDETGVEPERLTLEVTETALVTDLAQAAEQLGKIRAAGIRVAIDDFGTGYTSIAQLRALPIDELKIDRSFVSRLGERSERVLVQMIQDVASHLDLITVAEGVEDAAQADALVAMGCDALQGFHFAEPLAADEVVGWARASS
jgi:EAL domain-containing protein (putative c-di-GMP-specific phosphodiesterase class I)